MTFSASRSQGDPNVHIHISNGNTQVDVTEFAIYLRSFWHQLGEVLNEYDREVNET